MSKRGSEHAARLLASAEQFAQSALRARLDRDSMVYLLHAATALELLAKAFLASLDGSLIASKDFDSLLHGCGESRHARTPASRMKTITMGEALKRVGQIEPAFRNHEASLLLLADIRNGVVHAGTLDTDSEEGLFVPFLRACELLIPGVPGATRKELWGDFEESVDARLSESAKQAEVAAVEAVAAARLAFDRHYEQMEVSAKMAALAAIEGSYDVTKYEQSLTDCPACGRQALTEGSYEVEWEADWDQEGSRGEPFIVGAYPVVTYHPGYLTCRACGLELDGEEQLEAAGVEKSWQIEDVDPTDFYDDDDDY